MDLASNLRWLSGWFHSPQSLWQLWSKSNKGFPYKYNLSVQAPAPPPPPYKHNLLEQAPAPPPQPAAWMLFPYKHYCKELTFFDLCKGRIRKLELPESARGVLVPASNGWLVLFKGFDKYRTEISLFDPISNTQIPLPPFFTVDVGVDVDALDDDDEFLFHQVAVSSSDASQCIVAIRFSGVVSASVIALCKPQDKRWTIFEVEEGAELDHILFNSSDGALYVLNDSHSIDESEKATFKTRCITLGGGEELKLKIIPSILPQLVEAVDNDDPIQIYKQSCYGHCLVESKGRVLVVNLIYDDIRIVGEEKEEEEDHYLLCSNLRFRYNRLARFEVLEVETKDSGFTAKRLNSLDNQTLFVGLGGGGGCLSIPAERVVVNNIVDGPKKNSIYFLDDKGFEGYPDSFCRESGVFCLEDGSFKRLLPCLNSIDHDVFMAWFSPNITT